MLTRVSVILACLTTQAIGQEVVTNDYLIKRLDAPEFKSFTSVVKADTVGHRDVWVLATPTNKKTVMVKTTDGSFEVKGVPDCFAPVLSGTIIAQFWSASEDRLALGCGATDGSGLHLVLGTDEGWKEFKTLFSLGDTVSYSSPNDAKITRIHGGLWPGGLVFLSLDKGRSGIYRLDKKGALALQVKSPVGFNEGLNLVGDTRIAEKDGKFLLEGSDPRGRYIYSWSKSEGISVLVKTGTEINGEPVGNFSLGYISGQAVIGYSPLGKLTTTRRFVDAFDWSNNLISNSNFEGEYPFGFGPISMISDLIVSATRPTSADQFPRELTLCDSGTKCKAAIDRASLESVGVTRIDPYPWIEPNGEVRFFSLNQSGNIEGMWKVVPWTPRIPKFRVSKYTAKPGEIVTLDWKTVSGETVTINDEEVPPAGTKDVAMTQTMTFVIQVYGPGGFARSEVKVIVVQPAPVIARVTREDGYDSDSFYAGDLVRIIGTDLFGPEYIVRVALNNGDYWAELSVRSAAAELIDGYLPEDLPPGSYSMWVERSGEDGQVVSNAVVVNVIAKEITDTASQKAANTIE